MDNQKSENEPTVQPEASKGGVNGFRNLEQAGFSSCDENLTGFASHIQTCSPGNKSQIAAYFQSRLHATALQENLPLVTNNSKDFEGISALTVLSHE